MCDLSAYRFITKIVDNGCQTSILTEQKYREM